MGLIFIDVKCIFKGFVELGKMIVIVDLNVLLILLFDILRVCDVKLLIVFFVEVIFCEMESFWEILKILMSIIKRIGVMRLNLMVVRLEEFLLYDFMSWCVFEFNFLIVFNMCIFFCNFRKVCFGRLWLMKWDDICC